MEFTQGELSYLLILVQSRKIELTEKLKNAKSKSIANHLNNCLAKVNSTEVKLQGILDSKRRLRKIPGPDGRLS